MFSCNYLITGYSALQKEWGKGILFLRIPVFIRPPCIVPRANFLRRHSAAVIAHSGVMPARGVYIGMAEYIGNQINIAGFVV